MSQDSQDKDKSKLVAIDGGRVEPPSPFGPESFAPAGYPPLLGLRHPGMHVPMKSPEELEAEFRAREAQARRAQWAVERREFWKQIVINTVIAVGGQAALRPIIESVNPHGPELSKANYAEAKTAADLALKWFDEAFGHEFPADDLLSGKKPSKEV